MKAVCLVIGSMMAALSLTACKAQARSPESVPLDRAECARCRMLISSDRGGGEIVSVSDDTRFYDDVACLAADWPSRPADAHAFVRLPNGEWSDVYAASYAEPAGARTAMGSGLVAFASIAEARAVDRAGRALTFDDITRLTAVSR